MSPTLPLRPPRRVAVALAVLALATLLYSIVVAAELLLWFGLVGLAVGLYLTYLLVAVLFRLVEAVERIATAAEVDSGIRDPSDVATRARDRPADDAEVGVGPHGRADGTDADPDGN